MMTLFIFRGAIPARSHLLMLIIC